MMLCVFCISNAANYLTFTAEEDGSTFGIAYNYLTPDVQYSLNGGETWTELAVGDTILLAKKGDKALIRGYNEGGLESNEKDYVHFVMTGTIVANGSVMSLIDGVGLSTKIPCSECFFNLFKNCTSLTQAPELPATTLAEGCYWRMFEGCTSLTKAPELPATTLAGICYSSMFSGCTSLTKAPELPATTLADGCYQSMFKGCTSLTQAPELPATTLAEGCYWRMFEGCKNLTQAPELPATTLADYCYSSMFSGCTSLTQVPELPATTLADYCYSFMFYNCTGLTQAPELPAMTMAGLCYENMFYGCTSLMRAPELPATTLAEACYEGMFQGCTSLTQAPALPATTLPTVSNVKGGCYIFMFSGCTSLSRIRVSFDDWNDGLHTLEWVKDVAPAGTFICPKALPLEYGLDRIPDGWTVQYIDDTVAVETNYLTFTAEEDGSTFGIVNKDNNPDVQYSLDGGETWTALVEGDAITLVHKGDKALLRGDNPEGFSKGYNKYSSFTMTGKIAASGSVMSLIDGTGETLVVPADYCFYSLFEGCTNLTQAPELPATTLANDCYAYMFSGCTSLTQAPELPATTLADACYTYMFRGCTSLTQVPELPATTLAVGCYKLMFSGCTSLTQAPELPAMTLPAGSNFEDGCYGGMFEGCTSLTQAPELPATTLADACYCEMFWGCTSLTQAPELPATTLADGCYKGMFSGCTSLTQAPELPATTLADFCYYSMFSGCTSLTQAPELPATTLADACYDFMFSGCTNLSEIRVAFVEWKDSSDQEDNTNCWVKNVAQTGTFYCPKALPLEYGLDRIPEGWTVKYIEEGTGVNDAVASVTTVWTEGNTIYIRDSEGDVEVYDMLGRLIVSKRGGQENIQISVPQKGIYVVKVGTETHKVEL